jgi:hypothetical protein
MPNNDDTEILIARLSNSLTPHRRIPPRRGNCSRNFIGIWGEGSTFRRVASIWEHYFKPPRG